MPATLIEQLKEDHARQEADPAWRQAHAAAQAAALSAYRGLIAPGATPDPERLMDLMPTLLLSAADVEADINARAEHDDARKRLKTPAELADLDAKHAAALRAIGDDMAEAAYRFMAAIPNLYDRSRAFRAMVAACPLADVLPDPDRWPEFVHAPDNWNAREGAANDDRANARDAHDDATATVARLKAEFPRAIPDDPAPAEPAHAEPAKPRKPAKK